MLKFRAFIAEQNLSEMSVEKLRAYADRARKDYQTKIKTNIVKSIDRAKHVQKADIKIYNKMNEEAIPANNVGGGQIAGTGVGPNEPGVKRKRKGPRILKNVLQRRTV